MLGAGAEDDGIRRTAHAARLIKILRDALPQGDKTLRRRILQ